MQDATSRDRRFAVTFAIISALSVFLTGCASSAPVAGPRHRLVVAGASDLRGALDEAAIAFSKTTNIDVFPTYGSTGQLKKQIENGAPIDVFAAADIAAINDLVAHKHADESTVYSYGFVRLVLATTKGHKTASVMTDLKNSEFKRVAIANPAHAPYGRAAKQALEKSGIGAGNPSPEIVLADNVGDALRLVEAGEVDAAIVAKSLTMSTTTIFTSAFVDVPTDLFDPIAQAVAVTATTPTAQADGKAFVDFLQSDEGLAVLSHYGFTPK
jgi:molybdate transport system substrate-binding protein